MEDYTKITFCSRCGKRFDGNNSHLDMNEHLTKCNDLDEEFRGEIDNSSIEENQIIRFLCPELSKELQKIDVFSV